MKAREALTTKAVIKEYGMVREASLAFSAVVLVSIVAQNERVTLYQDAEHTHVHRTVISQNRTPRRNNPYNRTPGRSTPPSTIRKGKQNVISISPRARHPQRNHNRKPGSQVYKQHNTFHQRKPLDQVDIHEAARG